jgi:hypothetical protein
MNYYFMVRHPDLTGAVTLANFPCVDGYGNWDRETRVFVAWSDGSSWQLRDLGKLSAGRSALVREDDLPPDCPPDATPFLFLHDEPLPTSCECLPDTAQRETQPEWRANIQLRSRHAAVSYQGEYGSDMAALPRSSLLCLCPFLQSGQGFTSSLIFANLRLSPIFDRAELRVFDVENRTLVGVADVHSNSCSIVELDARRIGFGRMFAITSNQMSGIPLILTHNRDFTRMSIEHTHPPAEMALYGDRTAMQRRMKAAWFNDLDSWA